MITKKLAVVLLALPLLSYGQTASMKQNKQMEFIENYRPMYHFTPKQGWMNDPNGMVYHKGEYHLFFQYTPLSTTPNFGSMNWGHAVSKDLIYWNELTPGILPDEHGAIFSGSTVADVNNTSGFAKNGEIPLVAIFTHHNLEGEKAGRDDFQTQSIAYSLDDGKSWKKYDHNPVVPNPGIRDFRDPKVIWHKESNQWIMILATKQSITFYGSKNLKEWVRLSEFGEGTGAHGGVWECPDLLQFKTNEGEKWILLASINPGGPNTGSATQYFVGNFDGKEFTSNQKDIRWMDYGPDNYAGVTFSNTGDRKLLIGWMSNWSYAGEVPALSWRGGNTIVRELNLTKQSDEWLLTSLPLKEIEAVSKVFKNIKSVTITNQSDISTAIAKLGNTFDASFALKMTTGFDVELSNEEGDLLTFGFDKTKNQYFIDRSKAGETTFSDKFITYLVAPRTAVTDGLDIRFLIDRNSIELFADKGKTSMSALFFTKKPFTKLKVKTDEATNLMNFKIKQVH